jgi:hypothetical protein
MLVVEVASTMSPMHTAGFIWKHIRSAIKIGPVLTTALQVHCAHHRTCDA